MEVLAPKQSSNKCNKEKKYEICILKRFELFTFERYMTYVFINYILY